MLKKANPPNYLCRRSTCCSSCSSTERDVWGVGRMTVRMMETPERRSERRGARGREEERREMQEREGDEEVEEEEEEKLLRRLARAY